MNISKINNIDAIESFLEGNQAIAFAVLGDKHERYKLVQSTLIRLRYIMLSKPHKGMVIRFLIKITGYSRQQMTRLISKYMQTGSVHWHPARKNGFHKKYQRAIKLKDICSDDIVGLRNRLLLQLGYESMRRRSEICQFKFEDLQHLGNHKHALALRRAIGVHISGTWAPL